MAPPIYFLPHLTRDELAPGERLSHEALRGFGLDRTLADCDDVRRDCAMFELNGAGPGNLPGCLLMAMPVDGKAPHRIGYYPKAKGSGSQEWQEFAGPEKSVWVTVDPDNPPTPADLVRKKTVEGYKIELAGGQWIVPVIRNPLGESALPAKWVYQGDEVVDQIRDEYKALWDDHADVAAVFFEPTGPPGLNMDQTEATEACLRVLAVNYRVGRIEQNLLGLVDSETWTTILGASVDMPLFVTLCAEVQEKKNWRPKSRPNHRNPNRPVSRLGPRAPPSPSTQPRRACRRRPRLGSPPNANPQLLPSPLTT